jgi:hypothetical protein
MRRRAARAASAAGLLVLACAPAAALTVSGTVTVSPTCGGPELEAPGCSQPLAQARLRLLDPAGATLAETTADTQGRFTLHTAAALPAAATLRVQVLTATKLPRCPTLEVPAGTRAPLRIDCDSGRR